jgi:peroxiredoxin Q/BCP
MVELKPGNEAPAFALLDQHGNLVRLEDHRGRKLLVYFYPEADTPGCTRQSCSLRDQRQELKGIGADLVGISPDPPPKQLAFDEKYGLGFPLLADEDHAVAEPTARGAPIKRTATGGPASSVRRSSWTNRDGSSERGTA